MAVAANKLGVEPVWTALPVADGQVGADAAAWEEARGHLLPRCELAAPQAELPAAFWAHAAEAQRQM